MAAPVAPPARGRLVQPDEEPDVGLMDVEVARYEVRRIHGHMVNDGEYLFLIHWVGWPEDHSTYEPVAHLKGDVATVRLLDDYVDDHNIDMNRATGATLHGEVDSPEDKWTDNMRRMKNEGVLPHPPEGMPHFVPQDELRDPREEERQEENWRWVKAQVVEEKRVEKYRQAKERQEAERRRQAELEKMPPRSAKPEKMEEEKKESVEGAAEGDEEEGGVPAKKVRLTEETKKAVADDFFEPDTFDNQIVDQILDVDIMVGPIEEAEEQASLPVIDNSLDDVVLDKAVANDEDEQLEDSQITATSSRPRRVRSQVERFSEEILRSSRQQKEKTMARKRSRSAMNKKN